MKNQPKEVDEFAATEVLDSSVLEAHGANAHAESAALYEEYSRLVVGEARSPKASKKRSR